MDYLTDYYGGPSKVAELTGRTLYFHRKSYDKDVPDYNVLKYTQNTSEKRHAKKKEAQAAFVAGVKPVCIISSIGNEGCPLDITPDKLEKKLRSSIEAGHRTAGCMDITTNKLALQQLEACSSDAAPREIVFIQVGFPTTSDEIGKMHATVGTKCEKIAIDQSSQVAAAQKFVTKKTLDAAVQHEDVNDFNTAMWSFAGGRAVIEMAREILARGPESLPRNVGDGGYWRTLARGASSADRVYGKEEWPATWSHQLMDGKKVDVKKVQ